MNSNQISNTNTTKTTIKKSFLHKNCLSTGNLFFDRIVGGFSLGTTVLLIQDNYSKLHNTFLQYFLADGMVKNNKNILLHNNELEVNYLTDKLPYKSTQVESLLNAKKITDLKNEEMKIAWRYENIKYSNIIEDIVKSSDYVFDISRGIQEEYKKNLDVVNFNKENNTTLNKESSFHEKLDRIIKTIVFRVQDHMGMIDNLNNELENREQEEEQNTKKDKTKENLIEKSKLRIVIPNFFNLDSLNNKDENELQAIAKIKARLMALKNISRSLNGVIFVTVNPLELPSSLRNLFYFYFDYVFKINSFMLTNEKIEDYEGIFRIEKIPRINSLKMTMHSIESDTYGLLMDKRKLIIEQVDIGPEIDRNTKVKEKDIKPQKINIQDF